MAFKKGHVNTPEVRAKIAATKRGQTYTAGHRAAIARGQKARWEEASRRLWADRVGRARVVAAENPDVDVRRLRDMTAEALGVSARVAARTLKMAGLPDPGAWLPPEERLRVADLAAALLASGLATEFVRLPDTGEAFRPVRTLLLLADTDVDVASLLLARGWAIQGKYGADSAAIADAAAGRIVRHGMWGQIEDNGDEG